jgi:flagellar biosynthesis protein FlhA
MVDAAQGGELLGRIRAVRKQLAQEMGFIVPAIHIRDNLQLKPNGYSIILKGVEVAKGELMPGHYLAITAEDRGAKIRGIETKEPTFGLPAVWIAANEKESVQARGFVVVDPATVVTTHLTEIIKSHADELVGREEVRTLLDNLSRNYPKIVEELVPKVVSIGLLQKIMQKLLRERVSVRDLLTILETAGDYAPATGNSDILLGYVRQALARSITRQHRDQDGNITVVTLSPDIEDHLGRSIQHTDLESYVTVDPNYVQRIVSGLQKHVHSFTSRGLQPVILCSPQVRLQLRRLLERFFPHIILLSHNEITRDVNIKSLGMVEI